MNTPHRFDGSARLGKRFGRGPRVAIVAVLFASAFPLAAASATGIVFGYSGTVVTYTIPTTGLYDIDLTGAQGGKSTDSGERFNRCDHQSRMCSSDIMPNSPSAREACYAAP